MLHKLVPCVSCGREMRPCMQGRHALTHDPAHVSELRQKALAKKRDASRAYDAAHREQKRARDAAHREQKRAYQRAWRDAHREEINARDRARHHAWREKNPPIVRVAQTREERNAKNREYMRLNRERFVASTREWRAANAEHVRQQHKEWLANRTEAQKEAQKEAVRARNRTRTKARGAARPQMTPEQIEALAAERLLRKKETNRLYKERHREVLRVRGREFMRRNNWRYAERARLYRETNKEILRARRLAYHESNPRINLAGERVRLNDLPEELQPLALMIRKARQIYYKKGPPTND